MKAAFIVVIVLHGLLHLMGFLKGVGLAELRQLHVEISRAGAMLWLFAAAAYLCTGALLALSSRYWWAAAAPALIASQVAIVSVWSDAKYGTLVNVLVVVPLVLALLDLRPTSFTSSYRREVKRGLARAAATPPVTDADLERLPAPVQRYLRRVGVVGKPRVHDVRVAFRGEMKGKPGADWMATRVEQHSFFDEPTRAFLMEAKMFGIPFEVFHLYVGPSATMRVRIGGLLQIVDAHGPEMNQSETVTMFNDMCLLAPATLVDAAVQWETIDRAARARHIYQCGKHDLRNPRVR